MSAEFQCTNCGESLRVKEVTCGECSVATETWQQMAERLGVDLCRTMVRDGEQSFRKNDAWVGIGRRSEKPVVRVGQQSKSEPKDIRDLADCLQVAARYLEGPI